MEGSQLFYDALVGRMTASIPKDFLEQHGIEDEGNFANRIGEDRHRTWPTVGGWSRVLQTAPTEVDLTE